MIKSNELKQMPIPDDFNDDDKAEYEKLLNESRIEHPDIYEKEKWIIHFGIIMYIRKHKGLAQPYSDEEFNEIVKRYELQEKEVKCDSNVLPYLYDKENNPIFKDDSYFFKNDEEGKVAESKAESKVQLEIA